ncbi:hypothetical protein C8J57DRAFT_1295200 [Mycena rebaudengoi]|nr:hypothetical protein C8J57DRAFT_1295200 [Mycena rebaudengoi]
MQEKKMHYAASMHRATLIAAATSTVHFRTPLSSAEPFFDSEGGPSGPEAVGVGGPSVGGAPVGGAALPLDVCEADSEAGAEAGEEAEAGAEAEASPSGRNHAPIPALHSASIAAVTFSFGMEQVATPQSVTLSFQSAEAHIHVVFGRAARVHPPIQSSCSSVRPLTASAEASRTFEARARPKTISNTPRIDLS